jgi:hypothetical protein
MLYYRYTERDEVKSDLARVGCLGVLGLWSMAQDWTSE